jgi:GxxExxY protein
MNKSPLQELIYNLSERVYTNLGSGHNEQIYQKALFYELICHGLNADMERHINVIYEDSIGIKHHLVSERIDIFIHKNTESVFEELHENNVVLELKAISKILNIIEITQINKYFRELDKEGTPVTYGILINFPQPSGKGVSDTIDFKVITSCIVLD